MSIRNLITDAIAALEALLGLLEQCRAGLLAPYAGWADASPSPGTDAHGLPVLTPRPLVLGPPVNLGSSHVADPLKSILRRLARVGAPTAALQAVRRQVEKVTQLVAAYEQGLYAGLSPSEWRALVARVCEPGEDLALEARRELETWEKSHAESEGPDDTFLKDRSLIFAEDFVRMFRGEIGIDAARRALSSGRYGQVLRVGKRVAVRKEAMFQALKEAATAREEQSKRASSALRASAPRAKRAPRRAAARPST